MCITDENAKTNWKIKIHGIIVEWQFFFPFLFFGHFLWIKILGYEIYATNHNAPFYQIHLIPVSNYALICIKYVMHLHYSNW